MAWETILGNNLKILNPQMKDHAYGVIVLLLMKLGVKQVVPGWGLTVSDKPYYHWQFGMQVYVHSIHNHIAIAMW